MWSILNGQGKMGEMGKRNGRSSALREFLIARCCSENLERVAVV